MRLSLIALQKAAFFLKRKQVFVFDAEALLEAFARKTALQLQLGRFFKRTLLGIVEGLGEGQGKVGICLHCCAFISNEYKF